MLQNRNQPLIDMGKAKSPISKLFHNWLLAASEAFVEDRFLNEMSQWETQKFREYEEWINMGDLGPEERHESQYD